MVMFLTRFAGKLRTASFILKMQNISLPEKLKGGRVEKWMEFWKAVADDYRQVAKDVLKESKEKPVKAAAYIGGLGFLGYAIKTNPDELSFQNYLVICTQRLLLVSDAIRNPESDRHIQLVNKAYTEGIVRRMNLGVLSVMWLHNYHPSCCLYEAQCSYLQPQYATFHERIIDVGFLGYWFNLRRKMIDYDVNPSEWIGKERATL